MWLEKRKPENLSIDTCLERSANVLLKVVVNNIFHIYGIQIIGPWMEDLEALMLDTLIDIPLNIVPEELESSLVCLDWVAQVVFVHLFLLWVSQETTDGFDARS